MAPQRKALLVATYTYQDAGLRQLAAPAHDAEGLAEVLRNPDIAGFDVTVLLNEPLQVVGEAIGEFYSCCGREDLTLLYFSGHGLKDDEGRLYLAMTNTRHDSLLFTGLPAAHISDAMDGCLSRRKVLILDCCYSGAFPAGYTARGDPAVHTLERFQGKGRAVLTASDATQYSFEGNAVSGSATQSVFTRYLVEAIRSGAADQDADGDIALDELYSWVHDRVVAEMPQMRPKKQEDVDGRIVIARNVNWELPQHLRYAIDSPIAIQRRAAVDGLADLHRRGNELVRATVEAEVTKLVHDDSRSVSEMAAVALTAMRTARGGAPTPLPERPLVPEHPVLPEKPVVPEQRRRGLLVLGVVAALVAAGVGVWAVLPGNDPPADQGSASESGSPTGTSPSLPSTSAAPVPVPGLPSAAPLSGHAMVFSWKVDDNTDLYLVDVAGNTVGQRLTSAAEPDFAPLISPDRGSIIYFHDMPSAPDQLRVVAADGTGDRPLFADVPAECAGDNYQPAWSPADPTVLAISCADAGGNRSLRLVTVGGEVIRELDTPDTIVDDLTFSRDGGTLVFWSGPDRDAQGGSLWSVAAAGGQAPVRLTDQPPGTDADPAWSPDGQQIAFRRGGGANADIFLMNPDGSGERPLVTDTGPDSDPTWSPDGSRIAFVSGRGLGDGQVRHVWVVGADGSGQRPLLEGVPGELLYSQAWSRR